MTQQWGNPVPPGQAGPSAWNRPTQAWGPPATYPTQPYPQGQQAPYGGYPQTGQYASPQAQFGQPAYGPPGGFPPGNRANPPGGRKKNPFGGVLLGLALVIAIGFFAIALTNYLSGDAELADDLPTTTPTASTPTTSSPTTAPAVAVPKPDFSPPAIPQPETYGEATQWLTQNSAYQQSLALPTDCAVPEIDMTTASTAALTAHLNDLTACLWLTWSGPVQSAGYELPRPPVTVYTQPITTGCGSLDDVNAVYCAADQRIYYAKPLYQIFPKSQQKARFVVESILAHEFGHTIQARTGILIASMAWEQKSSESEARVFSRRLEVQADCLAGMFSTSVSQASGLTEAQLRNLGEVMYNLGDDILSGRPNFQGDHGLGRSRQAWFTTGQKTTQLGACNTFTAPASSVR